MSQMSLCQLFLLLQLLHMDSKSLHVAASTAVDEENLFPNPVTKPTLCNRPHPSSICNPDGVLTQGEADRLNHLAFNLRRSTVCVCSDCNSKNLGASFGVYVKWNFTEFSGGLTKLAQVLRQQWKLGKCEDDIMIVVEAETKQAAFDMGITVENVITRNVGEKIFNECAIHFENSNFYQGLESMVNSYHDILRRLQRPKVKSNRNSLSLILGISLGVIALLLFIATVIIALKHRHISRQARKRQNSREKKNNNNNNKEMLSITKKSHFEYHLCSAEETPKSQNNSESDSEDNNLSSYDPSSMLTVPQVRTKRQLSDVAEETEEESDSSSRYNLAQSTRKLQITEL